MNIQHLWRQISLFFNSRTCRLCRAIMTSSSEYSLFTILYLCLKPLGIFQASMYANSLFDLPTSCFMRRSFTFCSRVRAFQDRNRQYVLLTQLHVLKGQVTLLHPLSSPHPYVLQSLFCSGLLLFYVFIYRLQCVADVLIIIIFYYEKSYIILHKRYFIK